MFRRSSDLRFLRGCILLQLCTAFPELPPVTGFHQMHSLSAYSGGTVRDSHPVILFSRHSHTPYLPRNWYSFVEGIVAY